MQRAASGCALAVHWLSGSVQTRYPIGRTGGGKGPRCRVSDWSRAGAAAQLQTASEIPAPLSGGMMSANYRLSGPSGGESRIYVGNLPTDVRIRDIEDIFYKYGKIRDIDLKNKRGSPPFAFVEFEDPRDAQDAVYGRNGYDYGVYRLRVEFQRGRGAGGVGGGSRGRPGPAARRSDFRVIISGLPPSGSWQDLKDHMREAGDVCYADVLGEGAGVVEFFRKEDMDYAIRKLDDTKFRSHEGETAYIRVRADKPRSSSYGRSRSRSLSRGRYSPYQSRNSPR